MGCTTSKIDNDDTVRRCKERRRLIKSAVLARHHLAAAHSDYLHSLRRTGLALFDFSSGESLSVSSTQSPPIFLDPPPRSTPLYSISSFSASPPPPSFHTPLPAPPPPPPPYSPTIASSRQSSLSRSRKKTTKPAKLPNLPSFTTYSGTPTPSQASSAWNWENFYPPSPPGSEFYNSERESKSKSIQFSEIHHHHHLDDNKESVDEETEQEELHCSEWGDRYTTSSSDTESRNEDNDEIRSDFGSSVCDEMPHSKKSSFRLRSEKTDDAGSSVSWSAATERESDMRMVVRHRDLVEIAAGIKEYFEKAASAGDSVSVLLETGRAQLDRSFRQLKKTVYHSNSMLSSLSSTWTSKPPLGIRYQLDSRSICEPGDAKSHCSTLEKLLAWEKKLYEEVKAREGVNMEHEKKLSSLQSQEYKGEDDAKLDKTKTSIRRLQSLIVVTSQAVSTTSSAIIHARDTELAPQLADLCHGFMYMWRSMNQFHEVQSHIIQQVRGLVHQASKGQATSELHRQATNHLEATVSGWHTNFCRLIKYHRDYIHSLHGWLKLTLLQVSNDTSVSSQASELFAFLDEWKQALDRCPDTVASEAIKSFVNVVHSISLKQTEELKIKRKAESASKELEKKASALRNLEKKFYQSYSTVGLGIPDGGEGLDSRDPLAEKKLELAEIRRRVEEETVKHARAIEATRAMTLNNIQTGLPGVFQAVTGFSGLFAEALQVVCTRSYNIK